jgi:hypothetical protein
MAAPLTGLGSKPSIQGLPPCACGCGRGASRGFPGDVHYTPACVPPAMRFAWEAGYVAPETISGASQSISGAASAAAADLFVGLPPT